MHIETRKEAIWYKWQRSVHTNSLHQLGDVSNIYDHKLPSSSTDPLCLWPIFIHFSLWALKICTLRCYTVICAKRYDRYVEKPLTVLKKKEYCSISRSRSKKSIFFWSSWASTTSIHRIMDSFVHWTKMNTLTDPLCIWLIFINFSLCGL